MIKRILFVFTAIMFSFSVFAFAGNEGEIKTVEIKTSAVCGMCKKVIEKRVSLMPGVKSCVLDVNTAVAKITFDSKKVSPTKIKKTIAKSGYNADEVKRSERVYNKLPECCQASSTHNCE